eukprot:TRINITY_DN21256_c0_g1_i2.p2 TRINITY_DN21256_c0_g1~~TRINITY_DN21256_c0_g1_i2.p2  ORF type:complete len:114 (-),score=20.57 TRINITY_DN21256_c0_g1_i2:157-456(-)
MYGLSGVQSKPELWLQQGLDDLSGVQSESSLWLQKGLDELNQPVLSDPYSSNHLQCKYLEQVWASVTPDFQEGEAYQANGPISLPSSGSESQMALIELQ